MSFAPRARAQRLPGTDRRSGTSADARGDGFAGGCISAIVLLIEGGAALLLGPMSLIRGWGRVGGRTGPVPPDWVPVLWFGAFTLGVLVIAVIFLRSGHPYAGAVQLFLAAIALIITVDAWHQQYGSARPTPLPTCPTRAGTPCAPPSPVTGR